MARVSQRWLQPEVKDKIHQLLVGCVTSCRDQNYASNFVDVLLTKTEKLMIGKRIAIALMLIKNHTPSEIDEKLKVSQTTIYTVRTWLDEKGKEYRQLLKEIAERDESQQGRYRDLRAEAEGGFLPPRPGTNWGELKRSQWQKAKSAKVPF